MSRLTRKRKFPTPYDDRKPPRSEQITHDETSTSTHEKRIFQRAVLSAKKHGRENNDVIRSPEVEAAEDSPMDETEIKASKSNPASLAAEKQTVDESKGFIFEDILFKECGNGKICCGVCQVECSCLIVHMNGNGYCTEYFSDIDKFKIKYSKYRDKQSRRKINTKGKSEEEDNLEGKCETQDLTKSKEKSYKKFCQEREDGEPKGPQDISKNDSSDSFKFGGVYFTEDSMGKVNCGICQVKFARLIVHMNGSSNCSKNFNMAEFKVEYSKYRHRRRSAKNRTRQQVEDSAGFKEKANECMKRYLEKEKEKDAKGFTEKANKSLKKHEEKRKAEDLKGFRDDANKRLKKHEEKRKEKKHEDKRKAEDLKGFRDDANKRLKKHEEKRKGEDLRGYKDNANKRKKKHEDKKKAEDPQRFKESMIQRKVKSSKNIGPNQRLNNFRRRVRYGPIFICSCCHQKLFENQVTMITDELREQIDKSDSEIRGECIDQEIKVDLGRDEYDNEIMFTYLCQQCKFSLVRGKFPKLCVKNGLYVDEINDEDLKLSELENNLIARNIIFQKIHKMPKSRWSGTHDRLINVPVAPEDVINTVENLPRTPAEAGIIPVIPVNLKRKMEYKTTHLRQLIDTKKIFKFLDYLCKMGHPSYKFYDDWNVYEKRCRNEDPTGVALVFPEEEAEILDLDQYRDHHMNIQYSDGENEEKDIEDIERDEKEDKEEINEEEEYLKKDPVRKYQYDYNKTTCMTNKFPEADSDASLNFAPAEGKIPSNILKDENWDINSFPNLHPTGRNKMFQERKITLTPQQYLAQRLKNKDNRFEQCTPYVFAAAGYIEEKQMERNIGVSYNKGKISRTNEGSTTYNLDDAFAVLDDVKGTPKYWKKAKFEILGKIDNFGPFHWFYTLSCADMRWNENFTSILREKGYKIIWTGHDLNKDVIIEVEFLKDGQRKRVVLEEFLDNECDESLHEFIRTNVFIATRNFIHRVKAFRTEILMGKNSPQKIKYWSDKMEFQGRGAGHIHGVAWCDLHEVYKLIKKERRIGIILSDDGDDDEEESDAEVNHLEKAYRNLRENNALNKSEEKALIDFVDRSVTCTLNPEMAAKMIDPNKTRDDGQRIIEIVRSCQVHYHTKTCKKYGNVTACRFRFPKFPMWETIITNSQQIEDTKEKKEEKENKHRKVLDSVMNVLDDEGKIEEIMNQYDKSNESISTYRQNRKQRIMKVLKLADVDPNDYVEALKESSRKGINVILARDIDELYVNNYNPEFLLAWDGNIDWSVVFDFFAVVTYVTEYFTKDESGTSSFLAEASKQIKNLPENDKKRCIKNVFLTHRQMGLSEAFMKILADIRLKDSNISSVFVPLGKREDISRYLCRADPDVDYPGIELFEVVDRDGLYYEKPNWIEKYLRRDMSEWNKLCFPQYVKMFDPCNICNEREGGEEDPEGNDNDDENNEKSSSKMDKDKSKYGQELKFHYVIEETGEMGKPLPNLMKLENAYPGEPKFLRKRRHPKSLRFFKVKRDLNPARFFLHELMMYKSFDEEMYNGWHDDEKCKEDYEKYKNSIKKVKEKVMEWMEDVEEARYFVEEIMKHEVDVESTGEILDPEKHQEIMECELEGLENDEQYLHLDPEGLKDMNIPNVSNWYKKLELIDHQALVERTCRLDKWQRKVLDIALKYVKGLQKSSARLIGTPTPDNVVVIGGAGSGKSTVIECLTQWCHRILAKPGDDPNSPYILKAATTGAAAVLIEGSTVHSCLGFDHSSKHTSLSDKQRELRREQLKNLKILIIDEFSMLKGDILYRIHLRLCEITQKTQYFGGINVFLFGDPAQLKPVRGGYIFATPNCPDYKLAYGDGTDSLWRSFKVINLEENHRQGKDKEYADMLNRMRLGKHTKEDITTLKSRVRKKGQKDIKDVLFISAKVLPVVNFNENAVKKLCGKLYKSKATHIQAMTKSYKPRLDKKTGRIGDSQFVDELNIKIGARVMLIYNIDVSDMLCNGAVGTVIGVEGNEKGTLTAIIINFDNQAAGKNSRSRNPAMAKKYPSGTLIKKMEYQYSLAKSQGVVSSTAKLIQFPLVLAWAVTVHKFQGQTVKSPQKVVIDLRSVFDPAQAYVMASRVQELEQLYILEEVPEDKIYTSNMAMVELDRLISVSMNSNPTNWERTEDERTIKVCFLNCRSLKGKFQNIECDKSLLESDVIILLETWLEESSDIKQYCLPRFDSNMIIRGQGKGLACYFKSEFNHAQNINDEEFCITKVEHKKLDIIGVYRSQNGDLRNVLHELESMLDWQKTTVIGGDFNICALTKENNILTKSLKEMGFKQIVTQPTHIQGGALDHIYISQGYSAGFETSLEFIPKYYSDHDSLCLAMMESS